MQTKRSHRKVSRHWNTLKTDANVYEQPDQQLILLLLQLFSPWAGLGTDQSSVSRLV